MRTFDFTPYCRSTVGFDRLFDMLDQSIRSDWPPYNIEKKGDDQYRITMTGAGFTPDEIELVQHGATLLVTGQKSEQPELLHQGIPLSFKQNFNLADHVKVAGANVEHGLLTVDLVREVPEQLKPRRIEIGARAEPKAAKRENQPKQIDTGARRLPDLGTLLRSASRSNREARIAENGDDPEP
jgi:molecular chaperone IbpA